MKILNRIKPHIVHDLVLIVLVVALVKVTSAVGVFAHGGDTSANAIHACASNAPATYRTVYLTTPDGPACNPGYSAVHWNITGPTGPIGPTGAQGIQGIQGVQGPVGATGSQGVPGPKGDTGSQGPQGATGAAGADGLSALTSYTVVVDGRGDTEPGNVAASAFCHDSNDIATGGGDQGYGAGMDLSYAVFAGDGTQGWRTIGDDEYAIAVVKCLSIPGP